MRPISIQHAGFANLSPGRIDLPPSGLVVASGPNGSGKSAALLETLAVGLWNRSVRGPAGGAFWREGGRLEIETTVGTIVRTAGGITSWSPVEQHETNTKTQAAVESAIGPFAAWRRAAVLSASDADDFATAPEGDQRRTLERLLALARFDPALKACREDVRAAAERSRAAANAIMTTLATGRELDGARARLAERIATLPSRTVEQLDAELATLAQQVESLETALADARTAETERRAAHERSFGHVEVGRRDLQGRLTELDRAVRSATCPTCRRVLQDTGTLRHEINRLEVALAAMPVGQPFVPDRSIDQEARHLAAQRTSLEAFRHDRVRAEQRAALEAERALLVEKLDALEIALRDAELERDGWAARSTLLERVETVLGLQGARALMLSDSIRSLEPLANAWLSRMGDVRVAIAPTSEKQSGETIEKISFEILSAGPARAPFGLTSGGQRRRVSVALVLALAQLSQSGDEPVWLDEIADSPLDTDGREGLMDIVIEMASTRLVVLISHDPAVLDRARRAAALRLEFLDGQMVTA